jgi:hypothetical protein
MGVTLLGIPLYFATVGRGARRGEPRDDGAHNGGAADGGRGEIAGP